MKKIKIYTAPMAGVSDYTFRESLEEFKPDLIFTEMINVSMLDYKKIPKILKRRENNAVQLFTDNEDEIKKAAEYVIKLGYSHINLNCGCPMKKITSKGKGSFLIKEPEKIEKLLKALILVKDKDTKISLKMRIGYERPENYLEIAKIAESLSLDHITVHGRTREQGYSGFSNWQYIKEIKEDVSIDVIGNGDIFDPFDALEKIKYSKVDGIMLARGILGNPFLIKEIREVLETGKISNNLDDIQKMDYLIKYIKKYAFNNENIFYPDIRKYINWHLDNIGDFTNLKECINKLISYDDIINKLIDSKK